MEKMLNFTGNQPINHCFCLSYIIFYLYTTWKTTPGQLKLSLALSTHTAGISLNIILIFILIIGESLRLSQKGNLGK